MKWTFASLGIFALGLVGLLIIFLFQDITVSNEENYYNLKEITEAAMIDAIDLSKQQEGSLAIKKEKFVESFIRRFAESTNFSTKGYTIEFYDIMEEPPKVTVRIKNSVNSYTIDTDDFDIINELSAILETDDIDLDNE